MSKSVISARVTECDVIYGSEGRKLIFFQVPLFSATVCFLFDAAKSCSIELLIYIPWLLAYRFVTFGIYLCRVTKQP